MSNLLEKSLLTGFGIFVLILFFTYINPFIMQFFEVNNIYTDEIRPYLMLIDKVDEGVYFVLNDKDQSYLETINYPDNLNITLNQHFIKYEFLINSDLNYRIYEYEGIFSPYNYILLSPKEYFLNISLKQDLIDVRLF